LTVWILVESPSITPLCACETYNRKQGLIKAPLKSPEEIPVIAVASVFTPAQNRGKGYAGLMMRLLSDRIRTTTRGQALSILYSDIGPNFYDKNGGWKAYDANELIIPSEMEFEGTLSADMLTLNDAKICIDKDVRNLKDEFPDWADVSIVELLPSHEELEWASVRDRHLAKHLKLEEAENFGAEATSPNDWGYVLWFHEYQSYALTVLRLREPPSDAGMRGLLQAALVEARRSGLAKVKIWSPSERLENVTGIGKVVRTDAVPAMLYFGENTRIHWRNIEALNWC
jgi:hypothetical protein